MRQAFVDPINQAVAWTQLQEVVPACDITSLECSNERFDDVLISPRMGNEHVIPQLYRRAYFGENPLKVYSADHSRAFCYIDDAIQATLKAMRIETTGVHTFNIGNDKEEITIGQLAERILERSHTDAEIQPEVNLHDPIARRCPDISRIREFLAFEPQVSLNDGLDITLPWYQNQFTRTANSA